MYMSSVSETPFTAALFRLKIWSKPAVIRFPMVRINMTHTVGMMQGSVSRHIFCQREQPSISAASYCSASMPEMAAR